MTVTEWRPAGSRCSVARFGASPSVARRPPAIRTLPAASVPDPTLIVTVTRQYASDFGQLSEIRMWPWATVADDTLTAGVPVAGTSSSALAEEPKWSLSPA